MDTPSTQLQGTSQVIQVLCHDERHNYVLHLAHTVPCSLEKDDAKNELPSSGFVPETNNKKTPKKVSVRVSFNFNSIMTGSILNVL